MATGRSSYCCWYSHHCMQWYKYDAAKGPGTGAHIDTRTGTATHSVLPSQARRAAFAHASSRALLRAARLERGEKRPAQKMVWRVRYWASRLPPHGCGSSPGPLGRRSFRRRAVSPKRSVRSPSFPSCALWSVEECGARRVAFARVLKHGGGAGACAQGGLEPLGALAAQGACEKVPQVEGGRSWGANSGLHLAMFAVGVTSQHPRAGCQGRTRPEGPFGRPHQEGLPKEGSSRRPVRRQPRPKRKDERRSRT